MSTEQKDAFDEQSIVEKRIDAQCFLNRNFEAVYRAQHPGKGIPKPSRYTFFRAVSGEPDMVISKLASAIKKTPLNNQITTEMFSALIPKLKLYKVAVDSNNVTKSETEIIFPTFFEDATTLFRDRKGRGFGAGLNSFTFDYNGRNPAEVDSLIECQLKLSFSSMSDIFDDRGGFSFADLISKPTKKFKDDTFNSKYYRIKAAVGYHAPDSELFKSANGKKVKKLIEEFNRVFYLELIKHQLDFKEDGRLSLTIDYMAATDRVMSDGNASNVLLSFIPKDLKLKKNLTNFAAETKKKVNKKKVSTSKCKNEEKEKQEREADYPRRPTVDSAYSRLTQQIIKDVKIVRIHVNNVYGTEIIDGTTNTRATRRIIFEDKINDDSKELLNKRMDRALKQNEKTTREKQLKAIVDADDDSLKAYFEGDEGFFQSGKKTLSMDVVNENSVVIRYFKFGDLLNAALSIMDPRLAFKDFKNIKFLVGSIPVRVDSGRTGSGIKYNNYQLIPISELFISFDLYVEYVLKNVVLKGKTVYPLKRFIKDIFDNLIANLYSPRCFEGDGDFGRTIQDRCRDSGMIKPTFAMELFTLETNGKNLDPLGGPLKNKGGDALDARTIKVKNYNTNPDSENLVTYYYIYGKHTDSTGTLTRNEKIDAKRGIYHLAAGQSTGFVKSIKFKKTDVKFQKEARMASEGQSSYSALITERYNADVTMFGNNMFRPGMMIYISPDSFGIGSTNLNKKVNKMQTIAVGDALGIGGYYRVIKVRNKIESGKFETEMECSWVTNGSGGPDDGCKIDPDQFTKDGC